MDRAEVLDLLADPVIHAGHIGQRGVDVPYDLFALLLPVLAHTGADIDGAGDNVKRRIGGHMELDLMEAVRYKLIAVVRKVLYHFR